ncbi:MAG: hypothetical protein Q7K41_06985, partial [Dehalococcoidales bacterium]|nr:hypothetical protein [Dehalococcoidales bacterium]
MVDTKDSHVSPTAHPTLLNDIGSSIKDPHEGNRPTGDSPGCTVVIVLWGLPRIGITIPLAGLIALMVAWGAYSVITYQLGSRALRR